MDGFLDQVESLDGQAGLHGHRDQYFEVFFVESDPVTQGVQLDDPDRFVLGADQRRTHDGSQTEINNALAQVETVVRRSIITEQRAARLEDLVDNRAADPDPFVVGLSHFHAARLEIPIRGFQDDEPAVRFAEKLK